MEVMKILLLIVIALWTKVKSATIQGYDLSQEKETKFWHDKGKERLQKMLESQPTKGVAKNVILFLGDGMGATSVTAGRILAGQMKGKPGEETPLSFEHFPFTGLSMTYSVDKQVTDSASSATAFLCGVKANSGTIGVNAQTLVNDCSTMSNASVVQSVLRWSANAKKSTGIVTTTRVTHATPSASYAHSPSRYWESDQKIPEDQRSCEDIALQLVQRNNDINVILGGGRSYFLPDGAQDPEPDPEFNATKVNRLDNKDLIKMWQNEKNASNLAHSYVYNKEGLHKVDPQKTDYLLGLFSQTNMQYDVDRNKTKEPSLAEMTEKAIRILQKNDKGFFLLVEGGRIDHGHHENKASKALHDVVAFADAVEVATKLTKEEDTLIVVTADHSHVMSIAGYADRGNPILGLVNPLDPYYGPTDKMPYTTIVYGNGPGHTSPRENLTSQDTTNPDYLQQSTVPMPLETHGGEDVAIYARGPQSFLYTGVHEQSYIPMVMAYASCVGPYETNCAKPAEDSSTSIESPRSLLVALLMVSYIIHIW